MTPPLYDEPAIDAASNLYFGADLGQIRVRHADGTWGSIGIDTLHAISAVECSGSTMFAGSDDGVLRRSDDGGTTWSIVKSLDSDEAIIDIDHEGLTWVITTTRQLPLPGGGHTTDQMSVYVAHHDDLGDLAISRQFPLDAKKMLGWFGARGQLVQGAYYINTFFDLYRLDLSSMQWKTITPPTTISSHHVDPKTGLLSAFMSKGIFTKVFVSQDRGETWKRVGRPPYIVYDIQFDSADNGYASRWNMSAFSGVWEIYSYDKGIDDWKKVSEAPFNCRPLRVTEDIPILCIASDNSIFSQRGGKWDVEFSAQ